MRFDPVRALLSARNEAVRALSRRDLLGQDSGSSGTLWRLPAARRILDRQSPSGCWEYPAARLRIRSQQSYNQLETFRALRVLVEEYAMDRESPAISRAAEFLLSCQTGEGDFRGICGNQYIPYYSAAFMELLIKAGFSRDSRIEKGFRWLLSVRQDDGGWAFPLRTEGRNLSRETFEGPTIAPDKTKPFSHLVTGVVLRAFAAHRVFRKSDEAHAAGRLLESRFFQPDKYPDRRAPSFWTSFSYPFWFTDLLSSLDSLSLLGFGGGDPGVKNALDWFARRQSDDGRWRLSLRAMAREEEPDLWITLAICRVFKRLADRTSR